MTDFEMVDYLREVNIVKLQAAARMAGLRWKNGDPDYGKAGIIEKLTTSPSIMRACYAVVIRMEGKTPQGPSTPNPFADDITDEEKPAPVPAPTPAPAEPPSERTPISDALIKGLSGRLERLEGYAISKATAETIAAQVCAPVIETMAKLSASVETRLKDMEGKKPLEFHFPELPPIEIDRDSAHKSYPKLLMYLQTNRRVILTGSAGTGKSMAVKQAAEHFKLDFYLQTPVTMDHQYLGHRDAQGVFHETPTFQAYTRGGVLLWDEADAGLPDAMLAANPIFDGNGFAVFGDGNMYKQHPDFMAVFNMNTDGNGANMQYAGRNRLDGATLARFGVRIHWEIDPRIESAMAGEFKQWHRACVAVRDFMVTRAIVDVNATPRHVKTGAALLATCGTAISREEIFTDVLKSGALSEVWKDVLALPAVVQFLRGF